MTPYQQRLTPQVKRLAEDLQIRHRAAATIDAYTYHVQRFADFTKKPLDCEQACVIYNACGDRHCPTPAGQGDRPRAHSASGATWAFISSGAGAAGEHP